MDMIHQPDDVLHWTFDENKFSSLDTCLSFRDDSQGSINTPNMTYPSEYSPKKLDTSIISENQDSCATPTLAPSYDPNGQSIPEDQFDDSDLIDPLKSPTNEVTITTTTPVLDAEIINNDEIFNDAPSVSHLTPAEIENMLKVTIDRFCLEQIDESIKQRTMSIEIQPPKNLRPRYKSDGTRQIEKSRTKPMVVKLPNLQNIQLEPNVSFLLRLSLIKYDEDPLAPKKLHVNKLEYHSNNVQELNDGTVCVPLTLNNNEEGQIPLPRLSIVITKLDAYKRELTPYSTTGNNHEMHENITVSVKEAKAIYKQFNMQTSRIACQLLIKQNETIHFTDITCETDCINEKDQTNITNKRSSNVIDNDEEYPCTSKSKRAKRSNN